MSAVPFRDGLGEVQSRLEWSRCRRPDMGFGRGFEHACYLLPSGLKDSASKVLELYPAALRWRRSRFEDCSLNVTGPRRSWKPSTYPHVAWSARDSRPRVTCPINTEVDSCHPSRKCPKAASGRTRSQMIFVIASIGTERIAPGAPHIQNQKTSEMMTRTGLRVNRLARSIGVIVWLPIR